MNAEEFAKIIKKHRRYMQGSPLGLWADLRLKDISGLKLKKINLQSAFLSGANLSKCDLSQADLSYADLFGADLSHAILVKADLSESVLTGVNLRGALIDQTNMSEADTEGAIVPVRLDELPDNLRVIFSKHGLWINSNGADGKQWN